MQRNNELSELRSETYESVEHGFYFWPKNWSHLHSKSEFQKDPTVLQIEDIESKKHKSGFAKSNLYSPRNLGQLSNQKGNTLVLFLTLLPVIISACLFLIFSTRLIKNWMQGNHICRSELLKAQNQVKSNLDQLMALNPTAQNLRNQLEQEKKELEIALISENPIAIGVAQAKIVRTSLAKAKLDFKQKGLIAIANHHMQSATDRTMAQLQQINATNKNEKRNWYRLKLSNLIGRANRLAVKPDAPDVAPIYELNSNFSMDQAISVSWISSFETSSTERYGNIWFKNRHSKKETCAATLETAGSRFQARLIEAKL